MKLNHILYHITEGKQGIPLNEQDEGVTGLTTRGKKPRTAAFNDTVKVTPPDPDVFRNEYKQNINDLVNTAANESSSYAWITKVMDGDMPLEPSEVMANTTKALNDILSDIDYTEETKMLLNIDKGPVREAIDTAVPSAKGKNNTTTRYVARIMLNILMNNISKKIAPFAPADGFTYDKPFIESSNLGDASTSTGEVSMMPGATDGDSGDSDIVYSVVKSLKDIIPQLAEFAKSDLRAKSLLPVLRWTIFKGNELTKKELMTSLIKTFKTKGIKDVNPLDLFDFLISSGVITPKSDDSDEEVENDDEKTKIPALDKGSDAYSKTGRVDDVSKYLGQDGRNRPNVDRNPSWMRDEE